MCQSDRKKNKSPCEGLFGEAGVLEGYGAANRKSEAQGGVLHPVRSRATASLDSREPRAPAAPASGRCSADPTGRDSACASGGLVAKVLHLCDSRQAETMGDGRTREP